MSFDAKRYEQLRTYTLGGLIDQMLMARQPTRIVRDWLPDGTPFMAVVTFGQSAMALRQMMDLCEAPSRGPVVPLNRNQRRKR